MQLVQAARANIRSFLTQCNFADDVASFDEKLYQECINDATQRGYQLDGDHSIRAYLREGVFYAATAGAHLTHRPSQIWIALYSSCSFYVDDAPDHFPAELPHIYHFNECFIRGKLQGSAVLEAYADILRRTTELYPPISSHFITTSSLDFITATLLEHETKSMKVLAAAEQYPTYQRVLSGVTHAYSFMVFPQNIAVNDYIQAIPAIAMFVVNVNDILSFYKEERDGETTNQISTLAALTNKSKLEILGELTEASIGLYKRVVETLGGCPRACEAFKHYAAGYATFHISAPRYRLEDLGIKSVC